jgi:hypothetical protein
MVMDLQLEVLQHLLRLQKQWPTNPNTQDLRHTKCMDTGLSTLHRLFASLVIIFEPKGYITFNGVIWHNFMDPGRTP